MSLNNQQIQEKIDEMKAVVPPAANPQEEQFRTLVLSGLDLLGSALQSLSDIAFHLADLAQRDRTP